MRSRWLLTVAAVGLAAPWLGIASATAAATAAAGTSSARAGGAGPAVRAMAVSPAAKATLSANPTTFYPPNALCAAHGFNFANTTTATGTAFPASTAYKVEYNGKKATAVTGTTSTSGGFTATVKDVSQPYGTYLLRAKAGTTSRSTPVLSDGDTCAYAHGPTTGLSWHWQGVGFDASTTASLLLSGAVYESTTTSNLGAFNLRFVKACPSTGSLPVSFQGYFGGTQYTFGSGSISC